VDELRDLVVGPLDLPEGTRRLLVSPQSALSEVPFALLFPGEVVSIPSGTTLGLLRAEAGKRGEGVFALGDPDYTTGRAPTTPTARERGGRLARLPGTRDEAKAVGDVVLLGAEATEAGVLRGLATRPRWRAVHLACHGLFDPEHPAFSSLALTPTEEDDGFLTCLEVFGLRVPADLVALSACETARGKVLRAEGVLGLARAFMMAGAPRVLCSLWKVDDKATQALMARFYALWNPKDGAPGLPAAEALRRAQDFVRSQERWRHPFYWAAWVLWGLP
jgi:CHAT domain-containing protein